jgi:hypothetical protein
LGAIGGHFFYLGKWSEGFRRIGFFFICNLYCFYRAFKEVYLFSKMSKGEFHVYCVGTVKDTGSKYDLESYVRNFKP